MKQYKQINLYLKTIGNSCFILKKNGLQQINDLVGYGCSVSSHHGIPLSVNIKLSQTSIKTARPTAATCDI